MSSRGGSRRGTPTPSEADTEDQTNILAQLAGIRGTIDAQASQIADLEARLQAEQSAHAAARAASGAMQAMPQPAPQPQPAPEFSVESGVVRARADRIEANHVAAQRLRQLQPAAAVQPRQDEWEATRSRVVQIAQDAGAPEEARLEAQHWLEADEARARAQQLSAPPPPPAYPPGLGVESFEASPGLEDYWEELHKMVSPDSSLEADEKFRGTFSGYQLHVPYYERNAFIRSHPFQGRTSHYHPGKVGDPLQGALCDQLTQRGCHAGAYEVRSLVPNISYGYDLFEYLKQSVADVMLLSGKGEHEYAVERAVAAMLACGKQQDAILQHQLERLAVLRKLSENNAPEAPS